MPETTPQVDLIDCGHGIYTLDAQYNRPLLACVHLMVEQGRVALIETGAANAVPLVLQALRQLGLSAESVDWVLVTHVHLDHAGAAGQFMAQFPNARLAVHPRGARHMIDPVKLWAGAAAVYGADEVKRMYGDPVPVAAERVVEVGEGSEIRLADRVLRTLDTPGHAKHHVCIYDERSRGFFTGDTFGLSYREFDVDGRAFILPTSSPVQFNPDEMHDSINRMMAYQPQALYFTHFGQLTDVERLAADMHRMIDLYVAGAHRQAHLPAGESRKNAILAEQQALFRQELAAHGCTLPWAQVEAVLGMDMELNAQGLDVWLGSQG